MTALQIRRLQARFGLTATQAALVAAFVFSGGAE